MLIRPDSIRLRLIFSSALWIVATLTATYILVVYLFHGHIKNRFEYQMADHLEELVAASDTTTDGQLVLAWTPADPRFNRPHSGWYWLIFSADGGNVIHRSPSSGSFVFIRPPMSKNDNLYFYRGEGPEEQALYIHERIISLPRTSQPYIYLVAGPISNITSDVNRFSGSLVLILTVLAILLLGLVWFQIAYGLKPLGKIRLALANIRSGKQTRLPDNFPLEVRPLVSELNGLIDYNKALLERARTQVGNLAHALKNPLTVLANEVKEINGKRGEIMRHHVDIAIDNVNHHLYKARIAGASNVLGAISDLGCVAEDLKFSLGILYKERGIDIQLNGLNGVSVCVEAEDLEEILGNLLDNACKWASHTITVNTVKREKDVVIIVEDDGPGVPPELREKIIKRGKRQDEKKTGSGIGLSIVNDIVGLYGGSLILDKAEPGGLRAELILPVT